MKKIVLIVFSFMFVFGVSFAQTPEEIIQSVRGQTTINNIGAEAEITIQRAGKTMEVIKMIQYTSKDASGLQRTMIILKAPAKYKNTRFLMRELKNGVTDQRVFFPALGKTTRIVAESSGNEAFLGTDFSYNDMAFMERDPSLDSYRMLPEETYKGKKCYVIEALPKNKAFFYAKTIIKVEKSKKLLMTAEFFDKSGKKVKQIELLNYKEIDGVNTPYDVKMTTFATNTASIISMKKIKFGLEIPEKIFTTKYLETGK